MMMEEWEAEESIGLDRKRRKLNSLKDVCACVRLEFDPDGSIIKWLRLKIPGHLLRKLEFPDDCSSSSASPRTPEEYDEKIDSKVNGPFEFPDLVSSGTLCRKFARCASIGSVMYAIGGDKTHLDEVAYREMMAEVLNLEHLLEDSATRTSINPDSLDLSHRFHFCDFSKPIPRWEISSVPFISPRLIPKVVSMEGKPFVFGGNRHSEEGAPFAEVFDPEIGYWMALPRPPFGRLGDDELRVFPCPTLRVILVMGCRSELRCAFNTSTWCWDPPLDKFKDLEILIHGWIKKSCSPVVCDDSLCWIDCVGRLCVYNLRGGGAYFVGPMIGLDNKLQGRFLREKRIVLLPLSKQLLGLLWCTWTYDEEEWSLCVSSTLHLSILRISLHKDMNVDIYEDLGINTDDAPRSKSNLSATVVASLSYSFEGGEVDVLDAHII